MTQKEVNDFKDELHSCGKGNLKCVEETFEKYRQISKQNSESMRAACGRGNHGQSSECSAIREEIRVGLAEVFGLNEINPEEYEIEEKNDSNKESVQTDTFVHDSNDENIASGGVIPVVNVLGKRHWWTDKGYSQNHFTIYENLNDYRYLTENRDEAEKIRDYLDNNTFNHTNQEVSLLRPQDLFYWETGSLPKLDYSIPKKIAAQETLPDTSSSVLEQILAVKKTESKIADKAIMEIVRTAKELYEGAENIDKLPTKAEAILNDPEARKKAEDAVVQGIKDTVNQVTTTAKNSYHALENGHWGDIQEDLENVGGSVGEGALTGGGIGKAVTTTGKGLTTLGKKVGAAIDTDNKVGRATTTSSKADASHIKSNVEASKTARDSSKFDLENQKRTEHNAKLKTTVQDNLSVTHGLSYDSKKELDSIRQFLIDNKKDVNQVSYINSNKRNGLSQISIATATVTHKNGTITHYLAVSGKSWSGHAPDKVTGAVLDN